MYRQVLLHEEDRRYQRILWREDGRIKTYQLNTLTFGVSSSPFLAIRTIQKLAEDESDAYSRAAKIIKNELYVDDLLTGGESIEQVRNIRDEIIALLMRGGFHIRQWASNDPRTVEDLPNHALHAKYRLTDNQALQTLGVSWDTFDDKICYSVQPAKISDTLTKRKILSEIARIYDPIGLLGPVVLYAKRLIQDVWKSQVHWDESVPQHIYTQWTEFSQQLVSLNRVTFDRKILIENCLNIQIHGFCDASESGYGACLYVRSVGENGEIISRLLCAKSRVAPIKLLTIPRLELCGALLLARLFREVDNTWKFSPDKVIFWCDSTIVLHWLKTSPHLLKTYIANRVGEIQELTESFKWRHVKTEDNPADAISRGQLPQAFLQNVEWRVGPSWLSKNENNWPNENLQAIEVSELKRNTCLTTTFKDFSILERYSSYSKLCNIIAYCLRFRSANKYNGPLCVEEIKEAEIRVLRILQAIQFSDELKKLKDQRLIRKSRIINLNPIVDENDLIRVGGRLKSSNLTFEQKHPILLPSRHPLTEQIIRETHEKHYHTGIQTTLHIIRQKFWLIDGKNQVRSVIRKCVRCTRFEPPAVEYKMGDLPPSRVQESRPFTHTGVDFCGPFYIKEKKFRNRNRVKIYISVFVCMSIKAIHLEIVSDLSTDGFIAALRRFIARRGIPEHIYSDNGTNFVGANNQLKELYTLFNSAEHKKRIDQYANEQRIVWHFIPPIAPHFGGLWESSVKLFKHHFKRVVGDLLFTFEELSTFVIEIEGILNSRPITPLSTDPNDMCALTPAHYLIGKPITTLPESNLQSVPANRLSTWQHITKVRQDFWARWYLEYLNELQRRAKWVKDGPEIKIGTMVLIKEKNLPCTQWALGRITKLYPGEDGIVRAVDVKTINGEVKRTTKCLCPLPIPQ